MQDKSFRSPGGRIATENSIKPLSLYNTQEFKPYIRIQTYQTIKNQPKEVFDLKIRSIICLIINDL